MTSLPLHAQCDVTTHPVQRHLVNRRPTMSIASGTDCCREFSVPEVILVDWRHDVTTSHDITILNSTLDPCCAASTFIVSRDHQHGQIAYCCKINKYIYANNNASWWTRSSAITAVRARHRETENEMSHHWRIRGCGIWRLLNIPVGVSNVPSLTPSTLPFFHILPYPLLSSPWSWVSRVLSPKLLKFYIAVG